MFVLKYKSIEYLLKLLIIKGLSGVLFLGNCLAISNDGVVDESDGYSRKFPFVENKGQWIKKVAFKADLKTGSLFLEKDGFTFNFFDPKFFESISKMHSGEFVDENEIDSIHSHAYRMEFINANKNISYSKRLKTTEYYNYFLGDDPSKWASDVFGFKKIRYNSLYKDIDLDVYSQRDFLKYDFIVHPEANHKEIKIKYNGQDKVYLNKKGDLVVITSVNNIIESKPYAYQIIDGEHKIVPCKFVLNYNTVTYKLPMGYNKNYDLIIDPQLIFSTYSGSKANNFGYTATFDSEGFLYSGSSILKGSTNGDGYPVTLGAYQTKYAGGLTDIGITKFDSTGRKLIYSTYLGGGGDDLPHSIIVNSKGELILYGTTESTNFPTTENAYDRTFNGGTYISILYGLGVKYNGGSDMIVARLGKYGDKLLSSTYLGGSKNDGLNYDAGMEKNPIAFGDTVLRYNYADDIRGEVLIDKNDQIYVVGCTRSEDFPVTTGVAQESYGGGFEDGVVFKMDEELSTLIWSTYIGGSKSDALYSIALDQNENLVLAGGTRSSNFPITSGVIQPDFKGGRADGVVLRLTNDGKTINHSTYYGSDVYDQNYFVELDRSDNVYLLGQTEVLDSTFIINVQYSVPKSGQFISKLSPNLDTIHWSTVFGSGAGGPNISPTAFLVDLCNKMYVSGWGGKTNRGAVKNKAQFVTGMEVTPDAYQSTTFDGSDFYVMVMEDDASKIVYGSFFGGAKSGEHVDGGTSRFDRNGRIYQAACAGCQNNSDFPHYPPDVWSPLNQSGGCNLGVFKFDFNIPQTVADFELPKIVCLPATFQIKNTSYNALQFEWDFGNGTKSTEKNPTVTYTTPGKYTIKLKAINGGTCNLEDSVLKEIEVRENEVSVLGDAFICKFDSVQIGILPEDDIIYNWVPPTGLDNPNKSNPKASPLSTTIYNLVDFDGYCYDTLKQKVNVFDLQYYLSSDSVFCLPSTATIVANSFGTAESYHWSSKKDFSDMLNTSLTENSISVFVNGKKTYYIKMNNAYCERVDSIVLDLYPNKVNVIPDTSMCYGDTLTLYAIGDITLGDWIVNWEPKDSILTNPDSTEIKVSPKRSMWYYVNITLGTCSFADSVFVQVLSFPGIDFIATADEDTIIKGDCTYLHALPDSIPNYYWSPPDLVETPMSQTTKTCPIQTTTYTVTAGNSLCKDNVAYVKVVVLDFVCEEPYIFVPNAFTPNSNGKNEKVFVRGKHIEEMFFTIYNRWGEKVFETKDQNVGWDGTYKGMDADPGVFVFYLEATCLGKHNFFKKGNITLIR